MSNNNKNIFPELEKKMTRRLIIRMCTVGFSAIVGLNVILFVVKFICSFKTWYGNELQYRIFKTLEFFSPFIIIILCEAGIIFVLIKTRKKSFQYLTEMLEATENIYNHKNELIELSPELIEVEAQMNHIKLNIQENERAAKEAEQRKNDLVVYLAHDLKTPLTSVIGYLTLLRDEQQISDELREKYLSISFEKAERLEDLINEFFEITRFNLTTLTLELSRINLTRMLQQISYEFQPMFNEKNLTCTLDIAPDVIIKCDVDKIQRVFDNLLRNAVNYSFQDSTIEITVVQSEDRISMLFLNHGNTIPQEKVNRIFEQFYRLDAARTSKSGGAGLGLAIAKEIVELHGGTISAASEDEKIIFNIVLPLL